jgi:starvation-inducible DNA-binding protein
MTDEQHFHQTVGRGPRPDSRRSGRHHGGPAPVIGGRHFRDYHLLLDEHAGQILAMTDEIAERARKLGGTTLRSIGDISHHQRLKDNDAEGVEPSRMLAELRDDNAQLARFLRAAHEVCAGRGDVATSSLIEVWIDQTEHRTWFLSEITSEEGAR